MPRNKDELPAIRVYTVCDESRYLIVRNVPSLGCGDELSKLFGSYGEIEECKPMDEEDCDQFTDVYWIKFVHVANARFAKRKLDEVVFLGNKLQVTYATQFESVSDTKEKLECRRKEVLTRLNPGKYKGPTTEKPNAFQPLVPSSSSQINSISNQISFKQREYSDLDQAYPTNNPPIKTVSSNEVYFPSSSMNETVQLVREKLDKIKSSGNHLEAVPASKKPRIDNRRRI